MSKCQLYQNPLYVPWEGLLSHGTYECHSAKKIEKTRNNSERNDTDMNKKNSLRVKNMMYEQQISLLPAKTKENLIDLIEKKLKPKKYALILHDKDTDEKGQPAEAHIHAMLSFENARSINSIAKLLSDKPQYIQAWQGDARNGYAYLIHATDKARTKHQYDISDVTANFDYPAMMQTISTEIKKIDTYGDAAKIKTLLNLLYTGEITKKEVEKQLTGAQYAKAKKQIEDVWSKHLQDLAEQWREEMIANGKSVCVIWMYGKSGTGKTSFAKEYAKKVGKGQPFYVAGSSKDAFQSYSGEHIIILDELRAQSIPYHDLLRILDPFGIDSQVFAPSRYFDKALAADLIIITTPYNPLNFYNEVFGYKVGLIDSFEQLHRRISLTINMTDTEILAATYDSDKQCYITDPTSSRPNPYSTASRPPMAVSADDIYNSMFD